MSSRSKGVMDERAVELLDDRVGGVVAGVLGVPHAFRQDRALFGRHGDELA
jgi:hypothetical protein